jgi:hypothetical protein
MRGKKSYDYYEVFAGRLRWNADLDDTNLDAESDFDLSSDRKVLKVKGHVVDIISNLSSTFDGSPGSTFGVQSPDIESPPVLSGLYFLFFAMSSGKHWLQNLQVGVKADDCVLEFIKFWPKFLDNNREVYPAVRAWFKGNASFQIQDRTLGTWMQSSRRSKSASEFMNARRVNQNVGHLVAENIQSNLKRNMRLMVTKRGFIGWADSRAQVRACLLSNLK